MFGKVNIYHDCGCVNTTVAPSVVWVGVGAPADRLIVTVPVVALTYTSFVFQENVTQSKL